MDFPVIPNTHAMVMLLMTGVALFLFTREKIPSMILKHITSKTPFTTLFPLLGLLECNFLHFTPFWPLNNNSNFPSHLQVLEAVS